LARTIFGKQSDPHPMIARGKQLDARSSLRLHWPEYLMEFGEMGIYLLLTCIFATLIQHPASPVRQVLTNGLVRGACLGVSIGATLGAIAMTPWGKQSGGHLNPAMTLAFYRLGKIDFWDAIFYGVAQFAGAVAGVAIATLLLAGAPKHPAIRLAATLPGMYGVLAAFVAEIIISCMLMLVVLFASNHTPLWRYTPFFVATLYAIFITFEAPVSGMSMNPARTFGPALVGRYWHDLWIYFLGPSAGMLIAAELFLLARDGRTSCCAKLYHTSEKRCIFCDARPHQQSSQEAS